MVEILDKYKVRFSKAEGVFKVPLPHKNYIDSYIISYSDALLLLGRAKYLFNSAISETNNKNDYASYVLVRAFFETAMVLGYLAVTIREKKGEKDHAEILDIAFRIHQGGKHFPSDEYLREKGLTRAKPINVYDAIDIVDKNMKKVTKDGAPFKPHREMYDTVLSEYGHPNHLGLIIPSTISDGQEVIDLAISNSPDGLSDCNNYINWGSLIFFYYWDDLVGSLKEYGLDLPKL